MTSTTMALDPSSTFDLDAAGAITIDGASITLGGDSDTAFDIDTSTLDIDSSGAVTIDSTSTIAISGDGGATFSDDTEAIIYDGSGNLDIDSVALDIDFKIAVYVGLISILPILFMVKPFLRAAPPAYTPIENKSGLEFRGPINQSAPSSVGETGVGLIDPGFVL